MVALIPLVLIPLIVFLIPESLRYLQLKGKVEEAVDFLKRQSLIAEDFVEERLSIEVCGKRKVKEALKELWSPLYWKRTLLLWVLWAVLVYTYHGIFVWLPTIYVKELGLTVVKSIEWTYRCYVSADPRILQRSIFTGSCRQKTHSTNP
jgi:putative MFS transporter